MTKKNVLLTGISGVLGRNIVFKILNNTNFNIIGLTADIGNSKFIFDNDRVLLLDRNNWFNTIDKDINIDTFINCGFPRTSDPSLLAKGIEDIEVLVKNVIKLKIKKIINISSQSVYSQKKAAAATESTKISPESLYGMTKYSVERMISALCKAVKDIDYSHIRLGSLVNLEFKNRMTYKFIEQAFNDKPLQVNSDNLIMSYLHVNDAAEALVKMLQSDSSNWNNVYNLGNSERFRVDELAIFVKEQMQLKENKNVDVNISNEDIIHNNTLDSTSFYKDFNWYPTILIKDMINEAYAHLKTE